MSPDQTRPTEDPLMASGVPVANEEARLILREMYGIQGTVKRLDGELDDNFLVGASDGERYMLKVAHTAESPEVSDFGARLLLHLATTDPSLPVQRVVPGRSGQMQPQLALAGGRSRNVRLTTFLDGRLLNTVDSNPQLRMDLGGRLAQLNVALRGFSHPAAHRNLLWDIQHAGSRTRPLIADLAPEPRNAVLIRCLDRFDHVVSAGLAGVRKQVVHNDLSGDNVVVDDIGTAVTGILDFGDAVNTALVADVAVAAAYQLDDGPDPLAPALDVVAGYHAVDPLTVDEVMLIHDLIITRMVVRIAITQWRAVRFPENRDYILRNTTRTWAQLDHLVAAEPRTETARLLRVCGMES